MSSGAVLIQPISIPQSAALNYASGDVRHVSPTTDPLDGAAFAQSTRQLAYRDIIIAQKVNELIQSANNKDQFINLPLIATTLPAGAYQVVTNFRIPPGFEARVLNVAVASTPVSSIKLAVGHNANAYGNTSYETELVTTFSEFTAGTTFYGTGELLVALTNVGARTATGTGSIALTMRPVAAQKGGLIGPGAVGPKGDKGDKGDSGDQGNPGSPGPAGPIGATWRGLWNGATNYAARDLVEISGSTWFAKTPNVNVSPPTDPNQSSATWDLVSQVGAQGPQGPQGFQGNQGFQGTTGTGGSQGSQGVIGAQGRGFNFTGSYNSANTYNPYDVVNYDIDANRFSFVATSLVGSNTPPPSAGWSGLFGPFVGAAYASRVAHSPIVTGGDYSLGVGAPPYVAIASGSSYSMAWNESSVYGGPPGFGYIGLSTLRGTKRGVFRGSLTVVLPTTADGLKQDWTTADVEVQVEGHGTVSGPTVEVVSLTGTSVTLTNNAAVESKVQLTITGHKSWVD